MNKKKEQLQDKNDEVTLNYIFSKKESAFNVLKATILCLFAGVFYYFSVPKIFEATATIEMAKVAGEPVEAPEVLLEKMKLPLYFSKETLQECGLGNEIISQVKIFDKIKPSLNKNAPMVSFVAQAQSSKNSIECLNVVFAEIARKQDALAAPLIKKIDKKLQLLHDQLVIKEEMLKNFPKAITKNNATDDQFSARTLYLIFNATNIAEINELKTQIANLQNLLTNHQTHSVIKISPIYSSGEPVKKQPFIIMCLCMACGVFLGLTKTWLSGVMPRK